MEVDVTPVVAVQSVNIESVVEEQNPAENQATDPETCDKTSPESSGDGDGEEEHGVDTVNVTSRVGKRVIDDKGNSSNTGSELNGDPEDNPSKVSRINVEPGSWKCKTDSCNAKDDEYMFTCKKCKGMYHYMCTKLPLYQIALLRTPGHRGYQCKDCVKIPEDIQTYGRQEWNDTTSTALVNDKLALESVIVDKDFLISSQKEIIDGMRTQIADESNGISNEVEAERDRLLAVVRYKDEELGVCSKIMENLKKQHDEDQRNNESKHNNEMKQSRDHLNEIIHAGNKREGELVESRKLLKNSSTEMESLRKKLEDAESQLKLNSSWENLQKTEMLRLQEELKKVSTRSGGSVTSNTDAACQTVSDAGKGIKDSCEFIESHAVNGAVFNGALLWMSIERKMNPENKWKAVAVKKFLKEEITDAKESLWRVCGDAIIKKKVNRQGASKTVSEINDICNAMNALAEKDSLPLFLATGDMVMRTPLCEQNVEQGDLGIATRLSNIEKSLAAVQKKMEGQDNRNVNTCEGEAGCSQNEDSHLMHFPLLPSATPDGNNPVEQMHTDSEEIENHNGWEIAGQKKHKKDWRKKMNILQGTGVDETEGSLSADVELVAHGIRKDTTGVQVSQYLMNKGLGIKSCDLLTKYSGARTLAYKITIRKSDLEKASAPDMWPSGVGVRKFKYFHNQRGQNEGRRKKSNFSQKWKSSMVSDDNERSRIWNPPSNAVVQQFHREIGATEHEKPTQRSLYIPPNHSTASTVTPRNGLDGQMQPPGDRQMRILNRNERDNFYPVQTNVQPFYGNVMNAVGSNSQPVVSTVAPRNELDGQIQLAGDRRVRILNRSERDNFYPMQTDVHPYQSGNAMNAVGSNLQDQTGLVSSQGAPMEAWSVGHTPVVRFENLMSQHYN